MTTLTAAPWPDADNIYHCPNGCPPVDSDCPCAHEAEAIRAETFDEHADRCASRNRNIPGDCRDCEPDATTETP